MQYVLTAAIITVIAALTVSCNKGSNQKESESSQPAEAILQTDEQRAAYAIGVSIGQLANSSLEQQETLGIQLDRALVSRGVQDAIDRQVQLTDEELSTVLHDHEARLRELTKATSEQSAQVNHQAGADYLHNNKQRAEVIVTDSGLQYEVIKPGDGPKPTADDTVTVHYTGKLIDETVFDSSQERGQPATFPLANVIKGWTEGLQLMPVGATYRFHIPAELAYGDRSTGRIPPGSVLVFDVELLAIAGKS